MHKRGAVMQIRIGLPDLFLIYVKERPRTVSAKYPTTVDKQHADATRAR
jgi:hypothetical protein